MEPSSTLDVSSSVGHQSSSSTAADEIQSQPSSIEVDDSSFLQAFERQMKMDDDEERTADSAPILEPDVSTMTISHQPSSSSISADELESQSSMESSANSFVFSVPTEAEINDSIQDVQSYTNDEGIKMLTNENPGSQAVADALRLLRKAEVQEAVKSVLHDRNVYTAMLSNAGVQACLKSNVFGNSTPMLTNDNTISTAPNIPQSSHTLFPVVFKWLYEHMGSVFNGLMTLFNGFGSSLDPNLSSDSNASSLFSYTNAMKTILFLAVFILLTVIGKRVMRNVKI